MRIVEDHRTASDIAAGRRAVASARFERSAERLTRAFEDAGIAARRAGRAFHAAGEALERTKP